MASEKERRKVEYESGIFLVYKLRNVERNGANGGEWADKGERKSPKAVYDSLKSGEYFFEFSENAREQLLKYIWKNDKLRELLKLGDLEEILKQTQLI